MIPFLDYYRMKRAALGETTVIKPHHVRIANAWTRLVTGTLPTPNLMILMPPRGSKTTLVTETGVEWAQSYFPDSEHIIGSCTLDKATESTIQIRNTLASDWYRSICCSRWGATLPMAGQQAGGRQDYFRTEERGSVKAAGVGTTIIGFGAGKLRPEYGGAIVVDDPLKAQEKDSAAARNAAYEFISSTLRTRRNRASGDHPTPMVLVMQRLHPDDPAGRLLKEERNLWTVLQLQALREDGTSYWEDRISAAELERMREADPDTYWAQYQQEPAQTARAIFKRQYWRLWRDRAQVERRLTMKIITADTAFKAKESADYSVLQCWGFEGAKGLYLLDQDRGQWDFPELVFHSRAFLEKHAKGAVQLKQTPASKAYVEDRASGTSLVQTLKREGLAFTEWLPDDKTAPDKVSRAKQSALPLFAGRVFVPDPSLPGMRWVDGFINEHSAFSDDDSHLWDDQVDSHTMASLIWMQKGGGVGPLPVWADNLVAQLAA